MNSFQVIWVGLIALLCSAGPSFSNDDAPHDVGDQVDRLVEAMNTSDGDEPMGRAFYELPKSAVPHLEKALQREDLKWWTEVALRGAVGHLDPTKARPTRAQRWAALYERLALADYDKAPHRDKKWDDLARQTLRDTAAYFGKKAETGMPDAKAAKAIDRNLKKLHRLGCRDPLLGYLRVRLPVDFGQTKGAIKTIDEARHASKALLASDYSPFFKFFGPVHVNWLLGQRQWLNQTKPEDDADEAMNNLFEAITLAGKAMANTKGLDAELAEHMAGHVIYSPGSYGLVKETKTEYVLNILTGQAPDHPIVHLLRGQYEIAAFRAIHGSKMPYDTVEEMHAAIKRSRSIAIASYTKAIDAAPNWVSPVTRLIDSAERTDGFEDLALTLFDTAIRAQTDRSDLVREMVWFAMRKKDVDQLAFADACIRTGAYETGIPLGALLIHERHLRRVGPNYLANEKVWKEIEHIGDQTLKSGYRSNYFPGLYWVLACRAEKWEVAARIVDHLPDKISGLAFVSGDDAIKVMSGWYKKAKYHQRKIKSNAD